MSIQNFNDNMIKFLTIPVLIIINFPPFQQLNEDTEVWQAARKDLAERTRDYVKRNPMSQQLQHFIEELSQPARKKRGSYENMYAVSQGDVVPLDALKDQLQMGVPVDGKYTVVPLIVPINLVATVAERIFTHTENGDELTSKRAILLGYSKSGQDGSNVRKSALESADDSSDSTATVVDNLVEEKLKSTTQSPELEQVLKDVQDLVNSQKKISIVGKEGVLCNVSGNWDSEAGGMSFQIKRVDAKTKIKIKRMEPPRDDGFLVEHRWNVTGKIPFAQSAQVIITVSSRKGRKIGVFLGECRVCQGVEIITGDWLIGAASSGCSDQRASYSFVADVFRKNNVDLLKQAHLRQMATVTSTEAGTAEDVF